ncbi:predicted protein [Chaetomium globosum CBS 148.51]|uniref:Uncharacterized protein n=1 Tax=Chaetomium globosum (strain ATCC 6205 / CBS 148.51 / DSM 1962 / NBRC 6347 / NRRL 1970) TaxID=306901 RepID=Q2GRX6_CHAGB|nr:uncharacterized protein CHGG_09278 [Chaetomium globosum CBS 148.51]EAQ85264.1 predicted protein [Chaetomium globosum CBS 148.51]
MGAVLCGVSSSEERRSSSHRSGGGGGGRRGGNNSRFADLDDRQSRRSAPRRWERGNIARNYARLDDRTIGERSRGAIPGTTTTENNVNIAKIAWLSRKDTSKAYGSIVVYVTKVKMASSSAFNNYIVDSAMGPTCSRQVPPGSFGVPAARGHGHSCRWAVPSPAFLR